MLKNYVDLFGYSVYKKQNKEVITFNNKIAVLKSKGNLTKQPLDFKKVSNKAYKSTDFLYHDSQNWDYTYDVNNNLTFDRNLDFGTITGITYLRFILRNSSEINQTLRDVNFSNNDNIDIFGVELNKVFKPNDWVEITLKTDTNGTAFINTDLNFVFNNQVITFHIKGIRAVVWTYLPNLEYIESKELKTDIFISQNATENRIQKRNKAIKKVSFSIKTDDITEFRGIYNLLSYSQKSSFLIPLWNSAVKLDKDLEQATAKFYVSDTINSEFEVNNYVLIWTDFKTWDFAKLLSLKREMFRNELGFNKKTGRQEKQEIYKSLMELEKGVRAKKDTLLMPLVKMTPLHAVNSEFLTSHVGSFDLEFKELL